MDDEFDRAAASFDASALRVLAAVRVAQIKCQQLDHCIEQKAKTFIDDINFSRRTKDTAREVIRAVGQFSLDVNSVLFAVGAARMREQQRAIEQGLAGISDLLT